MLKALKYVQGAVAKKDFVPTLTHFKIADGKVKGFNGALALSCPIALDLDVTPRAQQFVKAIETCTETIAINMTPNGRLAIKSGKFKAFVECTDDPFPDVNPEGETLELKPGFMKVLETLVSFIADDASRPWARGIMFRGETALVTNNIILVEYWLGCKFPVEVNIPKTAIVELIRIGEDPSHIQVTDNSVTFHFAGDRWLRTQLFETNWPDLRPILDKVSDAPVVAPPADLWEGVETIHSFTDDLGRIYFGPEGISTTSAEGAGASYAIPGLHAEGCYNHKHLASIKDIVEKIDFTSYPNPCAFFGKNLRGVIIGMRG